MGKYVFYLNRFLYYLSYDVRVEKIEEILCCAIVNGKGKYFGKYVSYLATDYVNKDKIHELEYVIKKHVEIIEKNYNFIIKVYHYQLPDFIPFNYHPSNKICLGESYDGRFTINFKSYTHMIVGGTTGSGKSNLIASILLNLNCDKLYLDLKGGADNPLLDYIEVITSIDDCISKLYEIDVLIESRLSMLRENKKVNLKRLIVVIDELYPILLIKNKKEVYSLIGKMLSRCRVAKVSFILCSQRLTTEIIPSLITANVDVRIAMRVASAQESLNIIGVSDAFHLKESGLGIVNLNGTLKKFKAYYVNEEKIGDYIPKLDKNNLTWLFIEETVSRFMLYDFE